MHEFIFGIPDNLERSRLARRVGTSRSRH